jgi:hypothetical protein
MFVQATRVAPVPVSTGVHRLRQYLNVDGHVGTDAVAAMQEGEALLVAASGSVHKQVLIQSLRPFTDGQATVVPLRWVATGPLQSLVPVMDAHMELRPHGTNKCRLTLNGSYRPFTEVGGAVDPQLLHTVAQTTAETFVARVSVALQHNDTSAPRRPATA